jgi:hypothetical protein
MRRDNMNWIKKLLSVGVEGTRPVGRPKLFWMEVVKKAMERLELQTINTLEKLNIRKKRKANLETL